MLHSCVHVYIGIKGCVLRTRVLEGTHAMHVRVARLLVRQLWIHAFWRGLDPERPPMYWSGSALEILGTGRYFPGAREKTYSREYPRKPRMVG